MAGRHEFGGEKQSSESKEKTGLQNPPNSQISKPESVDALVSRFLDELSNISTGIAQDGFPAADSGAEPAANDKKGSPRLRLPDEDVPMSDSELEKINADIERSLAELESLSANEASSKDPLILDGQANPSMPAETFPAEAPLRASAPPPSHADPEEPTWNHAELFHSNVASHKRLPRFSIKWILAGGILVAVFGIAGYFLFRSDTRASKSVSEMQREETGKPDQTSGEVQKPPVTEPQPGISDSPQNGKSADPVKTAVQETTKIQPASSSTQSADAGNDRKPEASASKQDRKRPAQIANGGSTAERPKANEAFSRPASPQAAAITTPASEQPALAINPTVAASQPKPTPIIPSGETNNNGNNPAATVVASVAELSPAAPKPAPAADSGGSTTAEPKSRTAVMAEVISRVQPQYPTIARIQRIAGKVEVEAEVNEKGVVVRAKAVSGPELLRLAAEQALMKWKFKPASVDGVNVPSKALISVSFNAK
jgi:TonB family protein